ncbi:SPFH domain-containing protein [Cryptosporangium aurantiacum]|uniref:SPFH domain-containing protein n=1 Tax=Cryptosporangium aurantiacum TaxID=134849 RepID=UPI0011613BAC|nr:SPFH domain-containing protein [Cryptosporangium aurantiacum]
MTDWVLPVLGVAILVGCAYVASASAVRVPGDHVGVVYRRYGGHPGADFKVRTRGGAGPQAATLNADRVYLRPRWLYDVEFVPRVTVPTGTIGVVVAKHGAPPEPDRTLARHVECDSFQDGRAFLLGGGQVGRQQAVLLGGGSYDVNPHLFEVVTVDTVGAGRYGLTAADLHEISVPMGATGVVVVQEGAPALEQHGVVAPVVEGHASFQRPEVFLARGGRRGAQAETLSRGGVYRINPWFARVVLIPTRDLTLEWAKRTKPDDNFDVALDQIRINVEGHWLRFDMSQTIRIPPSAAPYLIGRFGEQETVAHPSPSPTTSRAPVQRFVERVIGRTVESYFHATAAAHRVLVFMCRHDEVRLELEGRVREAISEYGVEAVKTTLNEFESETPELDVLRRYLAAVRDRGAALDYERQIAEKEEEIRTIRRAGDREDRSLESVALEDRLRLLGKDVVTTQIFLAELAAMQMPSVIAGDGDALLRELPVNRMYSLIDRVLGTDGPRVVEAPVPSAPPPGLSTSTAEDTCVPLYLVVDESAERLGAVERGVRALCRNLIEAPAVGAVLRLAVVGLGDTADERLPLRRVAGALPEFGLVARGRPSLRALFARLGDRIPGDVTMLKDQGLRVRRPQVIVLTARPPTADDEWRPLRDRLVDRDRTRYAPEILACGIGTADPATVAALATGPGLALVAADPASPETEERVGELLRSWVEQLARAVLDGREMEARCPSGFVPAGRADSRER